jgi:transposase-like protein
MHYHPLDDEPFYHLHGQHDTKVVGPVQRYRCTFCGKTFSDRTFHIDYWTRKSLDYGDILIRSASGECVRALARNIGCSWASAQNRIGRLARNVLALHQALDGASPLREDLVADGFESFDRSQFFPAHIGIVVGKESQQLYSLSHINHARKGSMTARQRAIRAVIAKTWSCPRGALKESFAKALQVIPLKWDRSILPALTLSTDEHPAYPGAVRLLGLPEHAAQGSFQHLRFSSQIPRTMMNPLFAVNYMDREFRKDVAAHARESSCFVRNAANGMERLAVYLGWHNYWKQRRVRPGMREDRRLHAEASGIDRGAIDQAKGRLFIDRAFLTRAGLPPWAEDIWLKRHPTPLKVGRDYLQKHAGGSGLTRPRAPILR